MSSAPIFVERHEYRRGQLPCNSRLARLSNRFREHGWASVEPTIKLDRYRSPPAIGPVDQYRAKVMKAPSNSPSKAEAAGKAAVLAYARTSGLTDPDNSATVSGNTAEVCLSQQAGSGKLWCVSVNITSVLQNGYTPAALGKPSEVQA